MVSFILGVDWEETFRYKLVVKNKVVSQANSQTKLITAYKSYPMKGSAIFPIHSLSFTHLALVTPKREKFMAQIKESSSTHPPNGIDHLDGIGMALLLKLP